MQKATPLDAASLSLFLRSYIMKDDFIIKGKWVVIIRDIPVKPQPPKLSIHYAIPWVNEDWVNDTFKRLTHSDNSYLDLAFIEPSYNHKLYDKNTPQIKKKEILKKSPELLHDMWGMTPNPVYDVGISYQGEQIRIHGYEYNDATIKYFKETFPDAYEFIPLPEVEKAWASVKLSKEKKTIYEEALLDGCTEYEAMQVVYGKAVQAFPVPVGWYKLKEQYANYFSRG